MQTKEEALAVGEKLKELLIQVEMTYGNTIRILDGTVLQQELISSIDQIIKTIHEEILPRHAGCEIILYENGRSKRSFEFECQRLHRRALALYLNSRLASLLQKAKFLEDPVNASLLNDFQEDDCNLVQQVIIPQLEKYANAGDDFYLYTHDRMQQPDVEATIECIADTWKTPAEIGPAFYGMFGLLIQAEKAKQQGDISRAYSCLLDANHLIGIHEGAKYAMKHLPKVAAKRRAKVSSELSRVAKNKLKSRAVDLFYSLRPKAKDGQPRPWGSKDDAMDKVWDTLVNEAIARGEQNPNISQKTISALCQKLYKRDKGGDSVDIRVEVRQVLPDRN